MQFVTKWKKFFLLLFFCSGLSACSFYGLGYSFLDSLIQSKVDDIFELNYSQKKQIYPRIEELTETLKPQLASSLAFWLHTVELSLQDASISEKKWHQLDQALGEQVFLYWDSILVELSFALSTLSESQLTRLESKLDESNQWLERLTVEENFQTNYQNSIDKTKSRYEDWLGSLSSEQKEIVIQLWPSSSKQARLQLLAREKKQKAFVEAIRSKKDQNEILDYLRTIKQKSQAEWKLGVTNSSSKNLRQILSELRPTLSKVQIEHLRNKIRKSIEKLLSLDELVVIHFNQVKAIQ